MLEKLDFAGVIRLLDELLFFFHIGSWFYHRPNSCHCATDTKIRAYIVAWRKVLPTKKSLEVLFWTFFQISQQPKRIWKNQNHQKILLMQGYLSKVNL